MKYGFLRVACASPRLAVADCNFNAEKIIESAKNIASEGTSLIVFPELCITSYTCGDLFFQKTLLDSAMCALERIAKKTEALNSIILVGLPVAIDESIYNCAAVLHNGRILALIPKTFIPNYAEFYERRYFAPYSRYSSTSPKTAWLSEDNPEVPFGTDVLVQDKNNPDFVLGVEICEDVWVTTPPSSNASLNGATVIANLSASNEIIGKAEYRRTLVKAQSAHCVSAYLYADAGCDESTQDLVFGAHNLIAENGAILAEAKPFAEKNTIITDIDLERLQQERRKTGTFAQCTALQERQEEREAQETGWRKILVDLKSSFENTSENSSAEKLIRFVDAHPFVPQDTKKREERCREVIELQSQGLAKRLRHINAQSAVIGLSGGLDSTLALLVTCRAADICQMERSKILAITMPCFGTTDRTYHNACALAKECEVTLKEIRIEKSVLQHFKDIGQDENTHDVTYENSQARERTQVLMDIANKTNGIVIGTGDLSELALGWCTYNGDHMSMYGVNSSIPKTLVRYLVQWFADNALASSNATIHANTMTTERIGQMERDSSNENRYELSERSEHAERSKFPDHFEHSGKNKMLACETETPEPPRLSSVLRDILDTPVSPELLPPENGKIAQQTENIVGPYELHDFFLYYLLRFGFSPSKILYLADSSALPYSHEEKVKWLRMFYKRFFSQQFKRSCMPDGAKVGTINLSPRGDWRMPSDASGAIWLSEIDRIK